MAPNAPDDGSTFDGGTPDEQKSRQFHPLLNRLRTSPLEFRDENLAPEVDYGVLAALVRRELPQEQALLVYQLIYSFRSWSEAHTKVLVEEFQKAQR